MRRSPRSFLAIAMVLALCLVPACNSATWLSQLQQYLPVALEATQGILQILATTGVLSAPTETQAQAVEKQVVQGLTLLCGTNPSKPGSCAPGSLVGTYQANAAAGTLAQINATLSAVQTNLNQLLILAHVGNATTQATIEAAVGLVVTTLASIQAAIPQAAAAVAAGKAPSAAQMPWSVSGFKNNFNQVVIRGGFSQAVIK